jgi:hypothetical protein
MSNIVKMPSFSPQNWSQTQCWPPNCPPGPGVPPGCGCDGFSGLMQCWQDISQFQQFLQSMLSQMGPIPLQGVTDGSNALAGYIGEWVALSANFNIPTAAQLGLAVTVGVLAPGDWTCFAYANTSVVVTDISFRLVPVPAGFSHSMDGAMGSSANMENLTLIGPPARASLTVPTLVSFGLNTNTASAGPSAGTGIMNFEARRSR